MYARRHARLRPRREMAALLGAAAVLAEHRDELTQRVVFLFQPAGEGRSGAKTLTENHIIEKFDIAGAPPSRGRPSSPTASFTPKRAS